MRGKKESPGSGLDPVVGGAGDCGDGVEPPTDPLDATVADLPSESIGHNLGGSAPHGVTVFGQFVDELGDGAVAAVDVVGEHVAEFAPGEGVVGIDWLIAAAMGRCCWLGPGRSGPGGPAGAIRLSF